MIFSRNKNFKRPQFLTGLTYRKVIYIFGNGMEFVEAFLKKPIITDPSFKNGGRLKFFILVGLFKSYELLKDEFFQEIKTLNARRF